MLASSSPSLSSSSFPKPSLTSFTEQGGQGGIGQGEKVLFLQTPSHFILIESLVSEITAQLLLHGIATVFVVARSKEKFDTAREDWRHREGISLGENEERLQFVPCDLSHIKEVKAAAEQIKQKTDRIHILICNAGEFPLPIQSSSLVQLLMLLIDCTQDSESLMNTSSRHKALSGFSQPTALDTRS